ncbi:MAG: single-stranded DNA-binding protein, partial [Planctomycetota bacterium]
IVLWARRAEVACQYLKKGSPIFVEGRLELDQWQSPDGQKRQRLRVVADNFQFLDRPGDREGGGSGRYESRGSGSGRQPASEGSGGPGSQQPPAADFSLDEEDVPF